MASIIAYTISKWSLDQFQFNGILFYISQCLLTSIILFHCWYNSFNLTATLNSYSKEWIRYYKLLYFNTCENGATDNATEIFCEKAGNSDIFTTNWCGNLGIRKFFRLLQENKVNCYLIKKRVYHQTVYKKPRSLPIFKML